MSNANPGHIPSLTAEGGWAGFFALRDKTRMPEDFMHERPMNATEAARDPFAISTGVAPAGSIAMVKRKPGKKA